MHSVLKNDFVHGCSLEEIIICIMTNKWDQRILNFEIPNTAPSRNNDYLLSFRG